LRTQRPDKLVRAALITVLATLTSLAFEESALAAGAEGLHATSLREGESIQADGVLDEEVWARAEVITDFVGLYPTQGFSPAGTTKARVLVDEHRIYFGFRCRFDEPTRVRGYLSEREDVNNDDQIGIYIDPFGDGRRAYIFYINALGVQQDMLMGQGNSWNPQWDAIFKSGAKIVDGGFDVEVAIPFRSLRFPENSAAPWRILLTRKFAKRDEKSSFPAIDKNRGPMLQQFIALHGVEAKRSGVGLEFLPTVVGRTGLDRDAAQDKLIWRQPGFPETVDPGLGVKVRITPSITLDATVNPDFSQIEADPDRIDNNLRFAVSLQERRPFFLEGRELFSPYMLYTRSVVDPIYGIKLSGKQGRLSLAVLHALDENPNESFISESPTPGFSRDDVEDALSFVTYVGAGLDIGQRGTISLTWSDKEIVKREPNRLHSNYHGLDVTAQLGLDAHSNLRLWMNVSDTGLVDGSERLRGLRMGSFIDRNMRFWGGAVGADMTTPGHRMENSFTTRTDLSSLWAFGWRRLEPPGGPLRFVDLSISAKQIFEHISTDPVPSESRVNYEALFRLPATSEIILQGSLGDNLFQGRNFKGGRLRIEFENRALELIQGELWATVGDAIRYSDATQTLEREVGAELRLRAFRRLSIDLSSTLNLLGGEDDELARLWIYRIKATLGFTRALSLRLIAQGRADAVLDTDRELASSSSELRLSALLTLVPSPGTAVYLGYGHRLTWSDDDEAKTENIDIFLKGSLLIRL